MSQADRLLKLLEDGKPHRTDEIVRKVYGPGLSLSRVGARIYDLKRKLDPKLQIRGFRDRVQPTLYWYVLEPYGGVEKNPPQRKIEGAGPPFPTNRPIHEVKELFPPRFGVTP